MKIAGLRKEYTQAGWRRAELAADPIVQFRLWFEQALQAVLPEPNAMTLATVDEHGFPVARIVLLKGLDERGFHFFTNYQSAKARQLAKTPRAALVFHWVELERQVRILGTVRKLALEDTEQYFQSRPRGSRLAAWASDQSEVLADRAALESRWEAMEKRFPEEIVPVPPFWGGYAVNPVSVEFWQGRPSRLHDRFRYTRLETAWKLERLAP